MFLFRITFLPFLTPGPKKSISVSFNSVRRVVSNETKHSDIKFFFLKCFWLKNLGWNQVDLWSIWESTSSYSQARFEKHVFSCGWKLSKNWLLKHASNETKLAWSLKHCKNTMEQISLFKHQICSTQVKQNDSYPELAGTFEKNHHHRQRRNCVSGRLRVSEHLTSDFSEVLSACMSRQENMKNFFFGTFQEILSCIGVRSSRWKTQRRNG